MKRILVCSLAAIAVTSQVSAAVLFSDDFSYANGNLVGQGGWLQNGASATTPVQVTAGAAMLGTSGQDVNAALSSPFSLVDGTTFYIGATLNLSAAQAAGDYFLHWSPATGSTIFLSRLFAKSSGTGFLFGYQETSGTGASLTYGTTELNFNQSYRVVIAYNVVGGGANNDTANVYVSPTDLLNEGGNTPYLTDTWNSATAESTTIGAINLRQGTAANAPTLSVDGLSVATTFAEAATFTPVPEPSAFALAGLGIAALLIFRRKS